MKAKEKLSKNKILQNIAKSSVYGNLGLFIGTGMSMAICNDKGDEIALSWNELIYQCAEELGIDIKDDIYTEGKSYPEIATEIAKLIEKNEGIDYKQAIRILKEKIAEITSWYPEKKNRDEFGQIIKDIEPNWIITTNYDLIIECLLTGKCQSLGPDDQLISPKNLIPIYHLHGIRTNPDSIIISQEDYISLFRPNQYRQQKLSLSIKESTTLIIGYGLGDVNVLTAVDWSVNVYSNQKINYPQDIIQLLFTKKPKPEPYKDRNGILIIEFKDLKSILYEIAGFVKKQKLIEIEDKKSLQKTNRMLKNPSEKHVKLFIDDEDFRLNVIETLALNELVSGILELFSKAIDETWKRAEPNGAFYAYEQNLNILLDILIKIKWNQMPPALLESIVYNLDRVGRFVGTSLGESRAAHRSWERRKFDIPKDTILEVRNIARSRNYWYLNNMLKPLVEEINSNK